MEQRPSVSLETLLQHLAQSTRVIGARDRAIAGIALDSRAVAAGSMFIALRGEHTDGHRFVAQAAQRGAAAVVVEEAVSLDGGATQVIVPDTARAASQIADAFYARPSQTLRIAGVTGTNGKTTTTHMIASMLRAGGVPCGRIGTVGAAFGDRTWALEHTTPMAPQLHEMLAAMRDAGAQAVAMEVSSHALALQRVADVRFFVAALTNVTRDHLDFHGTFEAYIAAKRKLFEMAPRAVLNAGDPIGERWTGELRSREHVTTYAIDAQADVRPGNVRMHAGGSEFEVDGTHFEVRLPGRFNIENALCALAVVREYGIDDSDAAKGLQELCLVPGRMQHVRGGGVDAVIDYAHTPDALENVLRAARDGTSGRVLLVFGCGGDRDRGKRPQMGAIAARLADYSFVTSDNPRTEDPQSIADEIVAGMHGAPHTVDLDRRSAIEAAVAQTAPGDVLIVAGKGHEQYQIIGGDVLPFDDVEVVRAAMAAREGAHP